jgi:hypothetical protein
VQECRECERESFVEVSEEINYNYREMGLQGWECQLLHDS